MNKQIAGAMKAGIKDAALSHARTSNDSPAQPPHPTFPIDLPYMGFIHAGMLVETPGQLTGAVARYWASRVWAKRVSEGLEHGMMPENWVGVYVIGSLLHEIVTHPSP